MKTLTVHSPVNCSDNSIHMIPIYDIVFSNSFSNLPKKLQTLNIENRRICIVSETRVAAFYLNEVVNIFNTIAKEVTTFVFPEGESSKNLNTVEQLYEHLILSKFDRKDLLVALGGGVVGDLTGYTAATYLRGIDFIQIPTSLLSQVDSSIGGKTGVDFNCFKNMVGAFHQPKLVYINLNTLKTLNKRQFISGMGEIIKHGLIKDSDYYYWIKQHTQDILSMNTDTLLEMIYHSCDIKRQVVETDPHETGERALLNFGHTLGHAVEKLENFSLLHGECVSLGIVCASYLSYIREMISYDSYNSICQTLKDFGLPTDLNSNFSYSLFAKDILTATKSDKKMESGFIKFILLDSIGKAVIDKTITDSEIITSASAIGAIGDLK